MFGNFYCCYRNISKTFKFKINAEVSRFIQIFCVNFGNNISNNYSHEAVLIGPVTVVFLGGGGKSEEMPQEFTSSHPFGGPVAMLLGLQAGWTARGEEAAAAKKKRAEPLSLSLIPPFSISPGQP